MEFFVSSAGLLLLVLAADLLRPWLRQRPPIIWLISAEVLTVGCLLLSIAFAPVWPFAGALFLSSIFLALAMPIFWRDARQAPTGSYDPPVPLRPRLDRATLMLWGGMWVITVVLLAGCYRLLLPRQFRWTTPIGIGVFVATLMYVALTHPAKSPEYPGRGNRNESIDPPG